MSCRVLGAGSKAQSEARMAASLKAVLMAGAQMPVLQKVGTLDSCKAMVGICSHIQGGNELASAAWLEPVLL